MARVGLSVRQDKDQSLDRIRVRCVFSPDSDLWYSF